MEKLVNLTSDQCAVLYEIALERYTEYPKDNESCLTANYYLWSVFDPVYRIETGVSPVPPQWTEADVVYWFDVQWPELRKNTELKLRDAA